MPRRWQQLARSEADRARTRALDSARPLRRHSSSTEHGTRTTTTATRRPTSCAVTDEPGERCRRCRSGASMRAPRFMLAAVARCRRRGPRRQRLRRLRWEKRTQARPRAVRDPGRSHDSDRGHHRPPGQGCRLGPGQPDPLPSSAGARRTKSCDRTAADSQLAGTRSRPGVLQLQALAVVSARPADTRTARRSQDSTTGCGRSSLSRLSIFPLLWRAVRAGRRACAAGIRTPLF